VSTAQTNPLSEQLLASIRDEFPTFRILPKAGNAFSRLIDVTLKCVTLGSMRRYLTHYHTVIGNTLYVCAAWHGMSDVARVILLRHERVHLRQRQRYGFALFAFLYLVPFLPLGLAYGRARLEWEAYRETLRATAEFGGIEAVRRGPLRAELVRRFVSSDYGWMWPFRKSIGKWFDDAVSELAGEAAPSGSLQPPTGRPIGPN
jgi:hypothetical protein